HRIGWHLNEAEIQGIPLVIVVGAREMEKGTLSVTIRHTKEKREHQRTTIAKEIPQILSSIQTELFQNAQKRVELLTTTTESYDEFKETMSSKRGFIRAFWCERAECEDQIKEETKATTRCLPFIDDKGSVAEESGQCIKCGTSCSHRWLFAQAY
ncbi:proline--tRNA ligase, partial [Candidatus Woesebacteria bacterium]|nr:proline--tRNA ligase [Candidatus Woesebacteria bacterium]